VRKVPGLGKGVTVLVAATTALCLGLPGTALAAGDRSLDHKIVADPLPGSEADSQSQLQSYVQFLEQRGTAGVNPKAQMLAIAAEGWHLPSSTSQFVLITLVTFNQQGASSAARATQATKVATQAADSFCADAAGTGPFARAPVPSIPHSSYVICATANGTNTEAITTARNGIAETVVTTVQTIEPATFRAIALSQYEALAVPKRVIPPPRWRTEEIGGAIAVGVIVVLLMAVAWLRRRQRRRRAEAYAARRSHMPITPLPPAGWIEQAGTTRRRKTGTGSA
jgi:hypothetical protein